MRFTLTAQENHETGGIGWKDSRMGYSEIYGPIEGQGLAHDLLEHFAFESVADEIMAHGAMYWIRYEGGWSSGYGYTLNREGFAQEWTSLFRGLEQESYLPNVPKTRPLDDEIEEDISAIILRGCFLVREEFTQDAFFDEALLERLEACFRAFFRQGYRKARRRFQGLAACEVAGIFSCLTDELEHWEPDYEGQRLSVTVTKRGLVSVREIMEESY